MEKIIIQNELKRELRFSMYKIVYILMLVFISWNSSVSAMNLEKLVTLMNFENYNGTNRDCTAYSDDGIIFSIDGETVSVNTSINFYKEHGATKIADGAINVSFGGSEYTFPIKKNQSMRIFRIVSDGNAGFILVKTYLDAADGSSMCTGMWLVGKSRGECVIFTDLEAIKKHGLLFDDIAPAIKNGELKLVGTAKLYGGENPEDPMSPLGEKYKGVPIKINGMYCTINTLAMFWDETNKWFGTRLEN